MMRLTMVTIGALMTGMVAGPVVAQTHGGVNPALHSQRKGVVVLQRAIEAHGGLERMRAVRTVRLNARIAANALGQALRPGPNAPNGGSPSYFNQVRDLAGGRRLYEIFAADTASQPGSRVAYDTDGIVIHNIGAATVQSVDRRFAETFLRQLAYVPAILLDALDRAGTVRWIGESNAGGTPQPVITYADQWGEQHTLFFDGRSGELNKSAFVDRHAQFGDHVAEIVYRDYRRVGTLRLPYRIESRTAGRIAAQVEYTTVALDVPFDESLLEFPEDASQGPAVGATSVNAADLNVTGLGDGVYLIPGASPGYNMMFVAFDDHVLVLEAPISPDISRAVIEKIGETVPGKPIRYAAMTHYHFDHSGGLWGYIEEDVAIVTTPGNREFVREVAAAPRTLERAWSGTAAPRVEIVEGKRVFGDGPQRVELYDVGPNPHVDEILIAYVPSLKLLFVADIYSFGGTVTPANAQALALADKLDELDLDVEIVVPVHGQQTTGENFWEAIRQGRAAN